MRFRDCSSLSAPAGNWLSSCSYCLLTHEFQQVCVKFGDPNIAASNLAGFKCWEINPGPYSACTVTAAGSPG